MATTAGVGISRARDAREASREATRTACGALAGAAPDLCLVFATSGYEQKAVLDGVRDVAGDVAISGCSGEGVIAASISDEGDRALAVMAVRSDRIAFETLLVPGYGSDPGGAGRELARQVAARAQGDIVGLLVFPDGLRGNCDELLRVLHDALPSRTIVVGGTAGDAMTFHRTNQYRGGEAATDAVAAVLLRGRGRMSVAVSHGCTPLGLERTVTRSAGGWLYEIDGRPAWSVFKEYLDGDPEDLNAEGIIHLCLGETLLGDAAGEYDRYIIRTPLQLDRGNGALFFPGGGFRSGTPIRLTRRDPDRIRESARSCARRVRATAGGDSPAFVLQFDCAGRGRALFGSSTAEQIVRPLQEEIGPTVPWIGFHTFGEIAPIAGKAYYHNYTVALCAVFDLP